jgi:dihydrofolate reductase
MTRPPPRLALVAAVARNGVIGHDNGLAWSHPADLKHFRALTMGEPVIMGRRTWDSLPPRFRPLPGRANLVVTRQAGWAADGAVAADGLDAALAAALAPGGDGAVPQRVWVIGGGQLYALALPLATDLHLTEVNADLTGDTRFPVWSRADFDEVSREPHAPGDGPAFAFVHYRRRAGGTAG